MSRAPSAMLPFLYPFLNSTVCTRPLALRAAQKSLRCRRLQSSVTRSQSPPDLSHLDPEPSDYSRFIFQDKCTVTLVAGSGGHGCVSFLREKYIEEGPPNGGDGGSGGSIYIQAVDGLSSLHKLARQGVIRAGRGKSGQGKSRGGKRGHDVLIQVPVGTVIREIGRFDPVEEGELKFRTWRASMSEEEAMEMTANQRDRFVLYPGSQPSDFLTTAFPSLGPPRRPHIAASEPAAPIHLDLSKNMAEPMLLTAGAVGGFGNPHFVSRANPRPRFATKGEGGMTLHLDFELKLLADVGLVGFPNAGKSTLLRSLTNSRTRIGNWEFTTLSPNIGTVVLDNGKGRPLVESSNKENPRTGFTIADIPGLVEDAHLDRGLGLGFLRHIERAGILGFVVDLSSGNPIETLQKLWHELGEYDKMRDTQPDAPDSDRRVKWSPSGFEPTPMLVHDASKPQNSLPPIALPPIYRKPWFVIATKADLPGTQENFVALREYLAQVQQGAVEHPSGNKDAFRGRLAAVPVSAIKAEGVKGIPNLIMSFLEHH
ncbi:GTP-binding protein Obg [Talaromyces proteolyticus]|uniref:GTP-binding protein Obg n=1 Tax=Talaromyces proteolyticus TaxID=1131652 RepID=A0AAD4KX10_9EURO|nr:GTP-binding protein Obg [Talaromyces proteolyticus]KAH8698752.1 GTP-binding protein Obg [Talaromyces proteolyticus]